MVSIDSSSTVRCLILLESTQFCTMTNATLQSFITEGLFRRKSSQNYSMLCSTYRRNKPIARNARWLVMKLTLVTKNYSNSGSLSAVMVKGISYWRKKMVDDCAAVGRRKREKLCWGALHRVVTWSCPGLVPPEGLYWHESFKPLG